jgi:hypothetical protein
MTEWLTLFLLLLGCAAVTAGVICFVLAPHVAWILIIAGAAVVVVGGVAWTAVVKAAGRRARRA